MPRYSIPPDRREKISLIGVLVVLLLLSGGLIRLQVFEHAKLAVQSEKNWIRWVPIVPRRGRVFDRENRIIIDNRPSYTVSVVKAKMSPDVTVPNLSLLLGLDPPEITKRIEKNMVNLYEATPVKRDVSFETVAVLEEDQERFPGVTYHWEQVRQYRGGVGTGAFTGYVGEVSREDLKQKGQTGYRLGSMIGKEGLEKQYDRLLRGYEGTEYKVVSAAGQEDTAYKEQPMADRYLDDYEGKKPESAIPGADLVLTIDIDLQQECAEALDTFCCAAVVALDPRNGEVLALASFPGYDANRFSSVMPESLWQVIASDSTHPLLNRPLKGQYPPGSTVKLVTVGAALEEAVIDESETLKTCTGGFKFGNRIFGCWELGGHGSLTVVHALEQSCDVFMYQLGLKLGVDVLGNYFTRCGFGRQTKIDLPGESPGLVPNSAYYNEYYGEGLWSPALALNISVGQGELLVTPLQLAQFFCGLANNGMVYRPHIVKMIVYPSGRVDTATTRESFALSFSSPTLKILQEGIRLVVEGKLGTARFLKNERYSIGGKTGTAENPHGENHSWFVGIAPLDSPEIVVCAIVENAGHGSDVAAPMVGKIIDRYMKKKFEQRKLTVSGKENPQ